MSLAAAVSNVSAAACFAGLRACTLGRALQRWRDVGLGASSMASARGVSGVSAPSPSSLDQVMRVAELVDKSRDQIAEIWLQYHESAADAANKHRAGSVLSAADYDKMALRARESPMFVLPIKRGQGGGFETFVVSMQMPFVLLTSLEQYKAGGASSPPHVVVTHYLELMGSKGVVLARGDVVEKTMTKQEARTLMELTRALYTSDKDYALVRAFNKQPAQFSFDALLSKLGLDSSAGASK